MKRGIGHSQTLRTSQSVRIDPRIILASQLLELNQAELEVALERELTENPALERIDEGDLPPSAEEILKIVAPQELKPRDGCPEMVRSTVRDAGTEVDWVDLACCADSLADHLRAQLHNLMDPSTWHIAEYLVGSVNDRGYLTCNPEEVAMACQTSLEEVEVAIDYLQSCEPAGIGARDLRECLLLQLRDVGTDEERLARQFLKNDWDELVKKELSALRRKYKTTLGMVESAIEVVSRLRPFPGEGFQSFSVSSNERSLTAQPDIVLRRDETGWSVEVQGPSVVSLRIDRAYDKRYKELAGRQSAGQDEKRHIYEFVDRAKRFLEAVSQRRRLMAEIGRYLLERQQGFVATGDYQFLVPMTRSLLAKDLDSHESTISRATAGKFVQIATGEVVSFEVFFKPALRVQKLIEEILESEDPESPLSDESIARMLEKQGVKVARRTVNKYRDRTKLLSSRHRRSA